MAIPDNAVLRKAKNIKVGDRVCFNWEENNYVVESIETDSLGQVRHRFNDDTGSSSYHPGTFLYVVLA